MRAIVVGVLALTLLLGSVTVKVATAQQVPQVGNLEPHSAQTNFMSLEGYLRWLMFQQTNNWITFQEATRIVREQRGR